MQSIFTMTDEAITDAIFPHYVAAALWSTGSEDPHQDDEYHEDLQGYELSLECHRAMLRDVAHFVDQHRALIERLLIERGGRTTMDSLGHDLWLTRNHHGAGFWDRGYGEVGDLLTKVAHGMGEVSLCLSDDYEVEMM